MTKTLSLEASRLLQEKGVEIKTEKAHFKENDNLVTIPAPNFAELLLAMPQIGEKLGWANGKRLSELEKELPILYKERDKATGEYSYWGVQGSIDKVENEILKLKKAKPYQFYSHKLLDIFLESNGDMEKVSEEVINWFK